jgi:indolepyruvate decarboxylase
MTTFADYVLHRLDALGVGHIFGIPGDFILPLFQAMVDSPVNHVATCNELNAGYAADGYARLRGLGVAAVTYGPGAFSLVNAVAGAYAESVPLLVISGGPSTEAYRTQPVLHHTLPGNYAASRKLFADITVHTVVLTDPATAAAEFDLALRTCLRECRPVYVEMPANIQTADCTLPAAPLVPETARCDEAQLQQAVEDIAARVRRGGRTVLFPGHEVPRYALQDKISRLMDSTGLHAGSMFIGKAEFLEQHPQHIGAYQGAGSQEAVREYVEGADTVLFLGAVLSDFNLGGFTDNLQPGQVVCALDHKVETDCACYTGVPLDRLVEALAAALAGGEADPRAPRHGFSHRIGVTYQARDDAPLTNKRFYDRLAGFLRTGDVVAADAGCAINLTQLQFPTGSNYLSSCYWASIGMGFGAALGACFATAPGQRVIAVEGDGSFQMSAQELATMVRYQCPAIVFIINNKGYTAERLIHDGPFNDISQWRYHQLTPAFGGLPGIDVHTEGELEAALSRASAHDGPGPLLIEVHIDPLDASEAFRLMSEKLRSH